MNIGGVSCPEIDLFLLCRMGVQQLGRLEYSGGGIWKVEVLGGGAWPLVWLRGLLYTFLPHFTKFPTLPTVRTHYFSLLRILFTFLFLPMPLSSAASWLLQIHVASDISS